MSSINCVLLNNSIQSLVRSFTELAKINRSSSNDNIAEYYDLSDSIDNYKSLYFVISSTTEILNMYEYPIFIAKQSNITITNPVSNSVGWWFLSNISFKENTNKCKVNRWTYSGFTNGSISVKIYGIK